MMQQKHFETYIKSANTSERTITGVAAVHGNVDAGGDRSHPGAFARAVRDPSRVKFLWQHDKDQPPIARVLRIRELSRSELPSEVIRKAPEATGGLEVTRKYLTHPTAEAAYQGVLSGALNEMSYMYQVLRDGYTTEKSQRVRELYEVELYEASDVVWGMNAATVSNLAAKMRGGAGHQAPTPSRSTRTVDEEVRQFWLQNERELAQERAQRSKAIARFGVKMVLDFEATKRRIDRDQADEREIARLKACGLSEYDRRVQVIRLRISARRNGVNV